MEYSVVLALRDEGESIPLLHERITKAMESLSEDYEIIYVDDGSRDLSAGILKGIAENSPLVKIVSFNKGRGQSEALRAGFNKASGKWIITLDGDLQNPPEDIAKLASFRDNFDLIAGVRKKRKDSLLKKVAAGTGRFFMGLTLGYKVKDPGCSLRIFKKDIIDIIPFPRNFHRFFVYLVRMKGFSVKEVPVGHENRRFGKSKYDIGKRLAKGIVDLWRVFCLKRSLCPRTRKPQA